METILQSILDVAGVSAALVFDGSGRLAGYRGRAVYDQALCEQVSASLAKAVDAVALQQEDWDAISAQYVDGKLFLRKLNAAGHVLAVVADQTLSASFATVAIRVAVNKLKRAIETGAASSTPLALGSAPSAGASSSQASSRPVLANSGLSWSQTSSVGLSRVSVADPASSAFLSRCAKELARHVGPIAKVYVEEAVRRVSPDAPFSVSRGAALLEDLSGQIEDADDRALFLKALEKR